MSAPISGFLFFAPTQRPCRLALDSPINRHRLLLLSSRLAAKPRRQIKAVMVFLFNFEQQRFYVQLSAISRLAPFTVWRIWVIRSFCWLKRWNCASTHVAMAKWTRSSPSCCCHWWKWSAAQRCPFRRLSRPPMQVSVLSHVLSPSSSLSNSTI